MLDKNCPVVSPNVEDSDMSFPGHSGTPLANQTTVESEPYGEFHPSGEPQEESSVLSEELPSQENCRKDQLIPKETSLQEPVNLPLNYYYYYYYY